ncbi:hypothetical protein DSO57_1016896 [Entomophthora muscae]|uniref:Uncharacterized protein n=1 Tax=Entomophthora muscae TaxID=34485 RepID=A0ACC2SHG7_9FUNG|nr:hypothetical protein DSO57_1016896 [Entomophthora muscae]
MMGIKLPPIREQQVEDTGAQVPSSKPHIPLGTGRHLFPSLAIATCQWDTSADADVQEILELSFDELNSVLMQIEPGVSGQQIARALDSLSDHPNLKNVKTILTLPLDRVVAWSTGPTYPLIEAKLAEPSTAMSSSSFFGADPSDGIVVLATSPVPLLLVAAPTNNRFSFHINSLVSRTYRALASALDSGRAAAVGLAGFRPCLVTELQKKLTSNGYAGIAAVQVDYSLVDRRLETTGNWTFAIN